MVGKVKVNKYFLVIVAFREVLIPYDFKEVNCTQTCLYRHFHIIGFSLIEVLTHVTVLTSLKWVNLIENLQQL